MSDWVGQLSIIDASVEKRYKRPRIAARSPMIRPVGRISATRMVYRVQAFQAFAGDMGVDLRRRDVGMAEEQLNDA